MLSGWAIFLLLFSLLALALFLLNAYNFYRATKLAEPVIAKSSGSITRTTFKTSSSAQPEPLVTTLSLVSGEATNPVQFASTARTMMILNLIMAGVAGVALVYSLFNLEHENAYVMVHHSPATGTTTVSTISEEPISVGVVGPQPPQPVYVQQVAPQPEQPCVPAPQPVYVQQVAPPVVPQGAEYYPFQSLPSTISAGPQPLYGLPYATQREQMVATQAPAPVPVAPVAVAPAGASGKPAETKTCPAKEVRACQAPTPLSIFPFQVLPHGTPAETVSASPASPAGGPSVTTSFGALLAESLGALSKATASNASLQTIGRL